MNRFRACLLVVVFVIFAIFGVVSTGFFSHQTKTVETRKETNLTSTNQWKIVPAEPEIISSMTTNNK